jgi:hypothetical protein
MPFTADLNPKGGKSMDLLDMIKMENYLEHRKVLGSKPTDKTATPGANATLLKSNIDDVGVPFKFGNNYQSE